MMKMSLSKVKVSLRKLDVGKRGGVIKCNDARKSRNFLLVHKTHITKMLGGKNQKKNIFYEGK